MKIEIASPCPESWETMAGNERARFCGRCKRNVYNLGEMSEKEVADLFHATSGRACVRLYRRQDGTVLTKDCPVGRFRRVIRHLAGLAALLVASAGAFAIFGEGESADEFREWVTGMFRPPERLVMGEPPPAPPQTP